MGVSFTLFHGVSCPPTRSQSGPQDPHPPERLTLKLPHPTGGICLAFSTPDSMVMVNNRSTRTRAKQHLNQLFTIPPPLLSSPLPSPLLSSLLSPLSSPLSNL